MQGIGYKQGEVKKEMSKFWRFKQVKNKYGEDESTDNVLFLNGVIAEESWYSDDITPQMFRDDLKQYIGDITVWINSPGGDCFAASEIYTALKEHKGNITVRINGIAASAASVIAMAGDIVEMSPTSMMMIHNPSMMLYGEAAELEQGIDFLNEVKESIINAYQIKTGLSRSKLSHLMDAETWMNANSAHSMGFCDRILYSDNEEEDKDTEDMIFDKAAMVTNTMAAMRKRLKPIIKQDGVPAEQFEKRLNLLK
jgi:ATP-dependent Clp protease protease subunit|nr:MAG TPA: Putative ATP dependent Clp protease [Caudoviricetes sp.]